MARSKKDPPDQKNPTDKKARKRLERVDHHMHPAQGKLPYSGRWHRHQHHAYGAWHPFAMAPGALSTRAAGESGFTTGAYHQAGPFAGIGPRGYARHDVHGAGPPEQKTHLAKHVAGRHPGHH